MPVTLNYKDNRKPTLYSESKQKLSFALLILAAVACVTLMVILSSY